MLHHVQLAIPSGGEDEACAFYGAVLGMEEIDKPEALQPRGGCWFQRDGVEIHLGVEHPFRPARKAHPGIVVADLDQWVARLAAAGHDVTIDKDTFPAFRRLYVADPFGNRIELMEAR